MITMIPFDYADDEVNPGVYMCRVRLQETGMIMTGIRIEALGEAELKRKLIEYVSKQFEVSAAVEAATPPRRRSRRRARLN